MATLSSDQTCRVILPLPWGLAALQSQSGLTAAIASLLQNKITVIKRTRTTVKALQELYSTGSKIQLLETSFNLT